MIHVAESIARVPYGVEHPCVVEVNGIVERVMVRETDHCCRGFRQVEDWVRVRSGPVGDSTARLVEARELAACISRIQHAGGPPSLLQGFATETHEAWQRLLGNGDKARALPGADPWVRQNRARILACVPASGDDLEPLLGQIGLTAAPHARDIGINT